MRCGIRTTKCQLLATSLCVMLLGLSIATLSTVTHYGLHFTLFSDISLESNSYRVIHYTAFYFGICLSMTLILAALLSSAATVRESQCLIAMDDAVFRNVTCPLADKGFFCFALAFCGLIPAAFWRYMHSMEGSFLNRAASLIPSLHIYAALVFFPQLFLLTSTFAMPGASLLYPNPSSCICYLFPSSHAVNMCISACHEEREDRNSEMQKWFSYWTKEGFQVEDSMMDVYDLVYEEVRRNVSSFRRHELTAIHEAFLCCGKHSPFGGTTNVEHKMCPPGQAHNMGQDCLREIQDFLKKHMDFVSVLLGVTIGFTVYGMILTSFLWFSIHFSSNLDRKGKYILRGR